MGNQHAGSEVGLPTHYWDSDIAVRDSCLWTQVAISVTVSVMHGWHQHSRQQADMLTACHKLVYG